MAVTHERAVEVDTQLATIWGQEGEALGAIASGLSSLHWAMGEKPIYRGRQKGWAQTDAATETAAREKLAQAQAGPIGFPWSTESEGRVYLNHTGQGVLQTLQRIDAARVRIVELFQQARPLQDEYGRDPWPRFHLVLNTGGHVHRSMNCPTTFPTTQWAWLPTLSGLDEAAAVAEQGPRLCSVCFPSAPVEWTLGLPKAPRCAGSGQKAERLSPRSRYGRCPVCGDTYALSNVGAIRAHKPKEA